MKPFCVPPKFPVDLENNQSNPISELYEKMYAEGKAADYTSLRGDRVVQVIVNWAASGVKSYKAGRPQKFNQDLMISNGVVKQIELIGIAQSAVIPRTPGFNVTDQIDAQFDQGWLVIVDQCNEEILKVPLSQLNRQQNGNKPTFFNLANVQWDNCYVLFPKQGGISSSNGLLFSVNLDF